MRTFSVRWSPITGWSNDPALLASPETQLLIACGPAVSPPAEWFTEVARYWPGARTVYTSGGGQIDGTEIFDDAVVITGMSFDSAKVYAQQLDGAGIIDCGELGRMLGSTVASLPELRHVLVFVDGLHVNGAAFTHELTRSLPTGVTISGGLASDGTSFATTLVGLDRPPREQLVVAVAFCGASLAIGTGSKGGWDPFGPERIVTRAVGTTLYELDSERALDVYKRFLGNLAAELPGSALLFPLLVGNKAGGPVVVRTILGIDEAEGSLRLAGDVPQGDKVRLMQATNERLLDGAAVAASDAITALGGIKAGAVLCISCIGRRAILRSRIEEEIDEVLQFAGTAVISGYYSNGEISPPSWDGGDAFAVLHNQTMTVTAIGER